MPLLVLRSTRARVYFRHDEQTNLHRYAKGLVTIRVFIQTKTDKCTHQKKKRLYVPRTTTTTTTAVRKIKALIQTTFSLLFVMSDIQHRLVFLGMMILTFLIL